MFVIEGEDLNALPSITFSDANVRERQDLQRMLRRNIDIIAPDTLVLSEEFGQWEDSLRRIDLLCIDRAANLVVIELKRTEDGGHMELQAIRYAAMVSTLTFEGAVDALNAHLAKQGAPGDARANILEFLGWEFADEEKFAQDVRIVLASAQFSREITSAVLWLNDRSLDIRCVRLTPFRYKDQILVDVQQVIPLPEAEDYQIRIREKKVVERASRTQEREMTRYDLMLPTESFTNLPKRRLIYEVIQFLCRGGVDPEEIIQRIHWRSNAMSCYEGRLDSEQFAEARRAFLIQNNRKIDIERHFVASDELIYANEKTYAVSKMWGHRTLEAVDLLSKAYPQFQISVQEVRAQPLHVPS